MSILLAIFFMCCPLVVSWTICCYLCLYSMVFFCVYTFGIVAFFFFFLPYGLLILVSLAVREFS
jgi:hypothetical protein